MEKLIFYEAFPIWGTITFAAIVLIVFAVGVLLFTRSEKHYVAAIIIYLLAMVFATMGIVNAINNNPLHSMARKDLTREKRKLYREKITRTYKVTVTLEIETKGTKILSVDSVDLKSESNDNQK